MGPSQLSEKQNETRRERRRKHNRRRHEKDRLTVRLKSKKYQNLSKLIFPREKSSLVLPILSISNHLKMHVFSHWYMHIFKSLPLWFLLLSRHNQSESNFICAVPSFCKWHFKDSTSVRFSINNVLLREDHMHSAEALLELQYFSATNPFLMFPVCGWHRMTTCLH